MQRKVTLASLAAIVCLAGTVIPAFSQERTEPQIVEPFVGESLNRGRYGEMPIMENPESETWQKYFQQGEKNRMHGNQLAALRDYDRALALNPNAYEVFLAKAYAYEKIGNMQRKVIENFDIAVAMHPRMERVWLERSAYFERHNQAAETLRDLDEGIRYLPQSVNLRLARGYYYINRSSFSKALPDFDMAVQVKPDHLQALAGKALCEKHLKNNPAYEQTLTRIINIDGKRFAAWHERARIHQQYNRLPQAESDLSKALNLDPKRLDARKMRAMIRLQMGQTNPQMCKAAVEDLRLACVGGDKASCTLARKPGCTLPPPEVKATPTPQPQSSAAPPAPAASAAPASPAASAAPAKPPANTEAEDKAGLPEIPADAPKP